MDATAMDFSDGTFAAVVDKGLLDSVVPARGGRGVYSRSRLAARGRTRWMSVGGGQLAPCTGVSLLARAPQVMAASDREALWSANAAKSRPRTEQEKAAGAASARRGADVVSEVARVLRPGGVYVAVCCSGRPGD
jgi:hypothetical protein